MDVMWSSDLDKLTDTPLQYAALAVRLAHKYELGPNIRKRALYELLRREDYAQTEPWLKHHGRSESFRDLILPSATADGNPEDSSNLHFVSQEDLILLILVRQRLQSEWYTMTMSPRGISDFCTNAINGCKAPLEHPILWNKVAKALETLRVALVDPLKGLQRIRGYDWEGEGYCDTCVTAVECWCADEQVRLWTLLDEWFCANTGPAAADGRESEDGDNAEQGESDSVPPLFSADQSPKTRNMPLTYDMPFVVRTIAYTCHHVPHHYGVSSWALDITSVMLYFPFSRSIRIA